MTEDEINKLTDEAFALIKDGLSGKPVDSSRMNLACEFVRTIQIIAWNKREEARHKDEQVNKWPDRIGGE